MIRTKVNKQVMIDSQNGLYGNAYMQVMNPNFNDSNDTVQVDIQLFCVKQKTIKQPQRNESGLIEEVDVIKSYFEQFVGYIGIFKHSTWNIVFGGVSKEDYDTLFINTINLVNERERNNAWTGQELQRISYWAKPMTFNGVELGGITGEDLEIVTPQMLQDLGF